KRKIVGHLESGKASVLQVSREYEVSETSVYRWLEKYSRTLRSSTKIVVEMESEGYKTKELEKRIKELEAALGRKQLEVEFLNKMIEIGKEELGVDLKKKFSTQPSTGTGLAQDSTGTE
ncbi:MAG: transposase, partial [Flavisolibacter sp.]|nr:transposase [Flavisolibacter sp.]